MPQNSRSFGTFFVDFYKPQCYNLVTMKFNKSTRINVAATGATKHGEENDCVVRAIVNASGRDYDCVHAFLKTEGRKDRRGTNIEAMISAFHKFDFKFVGTFGTTVVAKSSIHFIKKRYTISTGYHNKSITLEKLMQSLPYGRFVAIIRGHAVAIVNGKLIDTHDNPRQARVAMLFQFGEMTDTVDTY